MDLYLHVFAKMLDKMIEVAVKKEMVSAKMEFNEKLYDLSSKIDKMSELTKLEVRAEIKESIEKLIKETKESNISMDAIS